MRKKEGKRQYHNIINQRQQCELAKGKNTEYAAAEYFQISAKITIVIVL